MKTRILIVEDDANIRLGLEEVFSGAGYHVESCAVGTEACECVATFKPHLVVLDVMLPGMSGYDICRELRRRKVAVPVVMLTAKGQEIDKVVGLDVGADDYVTKPFGVQELLARVKAVLRRSHGAEATDADGTQSREAFAMGGWEVDPKRLEIHRGKTTEKVTARELKLLQFFHAHPDEVHDRDTLLNKVWGYDYYGTTRTLDQTVAQLRKKLGEGGSPRHLVTAHGVGYRWVE